MEDEYQQYLEDKTKRHSEKFDYVITVASDYRATDDIHDPIRNKVDEKFRRIFSKAAKRLDRKLFKNKKPQKNLGIPIDQLTNYILFPESRSKTNLTPTLLHRHGFIRFAAGHNCSPDEEAFWIQKFWDWLKSYAKEEDLVRERNWMLTKPDKNGHRKTRHTFLKMRPAGYVDELRSQVVNEKWGYSTKQQWREENIGNAIQFGFRDVFCES